MLDVDAMTAMYECEHGYLHDCCWVYGCNHYSPEVSSSVGSPMRSASEGAVTPSAEKQAIMCQWPSETSLSTSSGRRSPST